MQGKGVIQRWATGVLAVLIFCGVCYAQTDTATVTGRVTDPTGAVVPGAQVVLESATQGTKTMVVTDKAGVYVFPAVHPGGYNITVTKTGFKTVNYVGLTALTQAHVEQDFSLPLGGSSETVTVSASAVKVTTATSVGTTISSQMVSALPSNGRTVQSLLALTPGMLTLTPGGNGIATGEGQISVDGMRTSENYMAVDGVSANIDTHTNVQAETGGQTPGFGLLGTTQNLISTDALQEVKVQTSSYSAEYGTEAGAQIELASKSGTNKWHGSLYEYLRNDAADAANWFVDAIPGTPKPPERLNDFGGTVGGPILKNRAFFFFSYEGNRLRLPHTLAGVNVPSMAIRQTAAPNLRPILNMFAAPTGPDNPDGISAQWNGTFQQQQSEDSASMRLDYTLNSKIRLFGRFSYAPESQAYLYRYDAYDYQTSAYTRTITLGADMNLGSSVVNQIRFNLSRGSSTNYETPYTTAPLPSDSLIYPSPLTKADEVFFEFYTGGKSFYTAFARGGTNGGANMKAKLSYLQDTASKLFGSHLLQFGADYTPTSNTYRDDPSLAEYLFLTPSSITSGKATELYNLHNYQPAETYSYKSAGAFAQDSWKATPRLTLDYGVRWDVKTAVNYSPSVYFASLDFVHPATLLPLGSPLYPTVWNAFAPRLGVAYMLRQSAGHELVLRGGYGLYWDNGAFETNGGPYWPQTAYQYEFGVSFPATSAQLAPPAQPSINNPPYNGHFPVAPYDYALPRVYQWNVALEQSFGPNQTLTVTYVGNAGRRLFRNATVQAGSSYPIASRLFTTGTYFSLYSNAPKSADYSNYNGLQVQFRRQSHSLSTILNYTWSHALDTSSGWYSVSPNWWNYSPSADYASADVDVRHNFSGGFTWNVPSVTAHGGFSSFAHALTSHWNFSGIVAAQSGMPVNLYYYTYGSLQDLVFGGTYAEVRPNLNPGVPVWISSSASPGGRYLNPAAFSLPSTLGVQGSTPRNFTRWNGYIQPDISIAREFPLGERMRLGLKVEAFNFINHPMFYPPTGYMGYALGGKFYPYNYPPYGFGKVTETLNYANYYESPEYAPGGPREMQVSMRLSF